MAGRGSVRAMSAKAWTFLQLAGLMPYGNANDVVVEMV